MRSRRALTLGVAVAILAAGLPGCIAGPPGPPGPPGPAGPAGPAGTPEVFADLNYQEVALALFPGVYPAVLTLQPGEYVVHAKLRLRNKGTTTGWGSCVFEPPTTSGLDGTAQYEVAPGKEVSDTLLATSSGGTVKLQCIGSPVLHAINSELIAIKVGSIDRQ